MKTKPYRDLFFELLIRGLVFAFFCWSAHLSGINWGAFGLGGFWATFCLTYPDPNWMSTKYHG